MPLDSRGLRSSKFGDGQAASSGMSKASGFSSFCLKVYLLLSGIGEVRDLILKWFCDEECRLVSFCAYNLRLMV